jgi:signal transduction histidine kinase
MEKGSSESEKDLRIAQLSKLSRHLLQARDLENAKLAYELHTDFGGSCSVIAMQLSMIAAKLNDPELSDRIERAMTAMREMIDLKRAMVEHLRPSKLDHFGLSFYLSEYSRKFAATNDLAVTTQISENFDRMEPGYAIAIFRIAQEAMDNVVKHASARSFWVTLQIKDEGLCLIVMDDGKGIAADAQSRPASCGLAAMRERALALGGTFDMRNRKDGQGTEIEVYIPLPKAT